MQVEPAFHQLSGIALEVAPVVVIDETRGADPGPGGQPAQLPAVRLLQGPVDGLKLVVLIDAQ